MTRTHSFTHGDLTITLHTRTGGDELDADVVFSNVYLGLPAKGAFNYRAQTFARIVTQTDGVTGDLGLTLPDAMASAAEHQAAYTALMARTDGLVRRWQRELDAVDKAPGDSDEAAQSEDPKESAPPPTPATGTAESTSTSTSEKPKTKTSAT